MLPDFNAAGTLPPGIHWATWAEVSARFGKTKHRRALLKGLRAAILSLQQAGCRTVFLDGSFVTAKDCPNDFDGCWNPAGVDPAKLDPILLRFDNQRAAQKAKFQGEMFPAFGAADSNGTPFVNFFQRDKSTGEAKGIVAIGLVGETL